MNFDFNRDLPQGKTWHVIAVVAIVIACMAGIAIYVLGKIDTPKTGDYIVPASVVSNTPLLKSSADQTIVPTRYAPGYPPEYSPAR